MFAAPAPPFVTVVVAVADKTQGLLSKGVALFARNPLCGEKEVLHRRKTPIHDVYVVRLLWPCRQAVKPPSSVLDNLLLTPAFGLRGFSILADTAGIWTSQTPPVFSRSPRQSAILYVSHRAGRDLHSSQGASRSQPQNSPARWAFLAEQF